MRPSILFAAAAVFLVSSAKPADAFTIQFDYSSDTDGFFAEDSAQRDRLEDAADFFEGLITTSFDSVVPSTENPNILLRDPSNGAPVLLNRAIAADTIVVYVGARSGIDIGGPALGEADQGIIFGPPRTPSFVPWGGSIAVNTDFTWDASNTNSVAATEFHLYSLLLHELGHVLGGPAHLPEGLISTIRGTNISQEAALDPTLAIGTVKLFTDADVTALEDFGWEVSAIPEPSTTLLGLFASFVLLIRRRR